VRLEKGILKVAISFMARDRVFFKAMLRERIGIRILSMAVLASIWLTAIPSFAVENTTTVPVANLRSEVQDFMAKEVAVHFAAI